MDSKTIAVLELMGENSLLTCPLAELEPQPIKGGRYVIGGNLYRVVDSPLSFVGPAASFDSQLIDVLALLHSDNPAAMTMVNGIRNVARDVAASENRSEGGLLLPGGDKPMLNNSDRLVYIQLKLEKRRPANGLLDMLSGKTGDQADGQGQ